MADLSRAERLADVRKRMADMGLDAFILQRTDQHNGEYLPASEERVAWLTGFTGSNALVAISATDAAVFSDGRYTVQLDEEVDPTLFNRLHIIKQPATEWIAKQLGANQSLGLDPYLTKTHERENYERLAATVGARVVLVDQNPVDDVWDQQGRPATPRELIKMLDMRFAGEAHEDKSKRMGEALSKDGADWLLVTAADEIAWLLNIRGGDIPFNPLCLSHLLLHRNGYVRWFVDPQKLPTDIVFAESVELVDPQGLISSLEILGNRGESVLVDPGSVHLAFSERLEAAGAKVIRRASPIPLAKACKNTTECEGARKAQRRDAVAVARFLCWLDQIPFDGSVSELDAAQRLSTERAKLDLYQGPSFDTISAHGPNAALPHYRVSAKSNRPLTGNTLYLVDSGGQYLDGTTDITRTVALGTPSAEMRERFTAVLRGHIALARAIFPSGTHGGQLDTLARQPLWDRGLDFDHGTGHGIGAYLCVHEGPQRIAKQGSNTALLPGMIVSNEPGYYKTGHYGIRIENLLIVEQRQLDLPDSGQILGFENITFAPIDRRLIDVKSLSDAELDWINDYHRQVQMTLAGQVEENVMAWLDDVCQPIHCNQSMA